MAGEGASKPHLLDQHSDRDTTKPTSSTPVGSTSRSGHLRLSVTGPRVHPRRAASTGPVGGTPRPKIGRGLRSTSISDAACRHAGRPAARCRSRAVGTAAEPALLGRVPRGPPNLLRTTGGLLGLGVRRYGHTSSRVAGQRRVAIDDPTVGPRPWRTLGAEGPGAALRSGSRPWLPPARCRTRSEYQDGLGWRPLEDVQRMR